MVHGSPSSPQRNNGFIILRNPGPFNGQSHSASPTNASSSIEGLITTLKRSKQKTLSRGMASATGTAESPELPNNSDTRSGVENIQLTHPNSHGSTFSFNKFTNLSKEESIDEQLKVKRKEVEKEIEQFRQRKEEEYRVFELMLRDTFSKTKDGLERCEQEGLPANAEDKNRKTATDEPNSTPSGENTTATLSLDKGESLADAALKQQESDPPFEKEIQLAGLFTPRYLPLLDNSFAASNSSAITPSTPASPPKRPATPVRRTAKQPSPSLSSSLKSPRSSSTIVASDNSQSPKLKSPKRVTFKLDETRVIPSRSTPPVVTPILPAYGELLGEEEEDEVDDAEVEQIEEIGYTQGSAASKAPEELTFSKTEMMVKLPLTSMSSVGRPMDEVLGTSLVTPQSIGDGVVEVAGGGFFREGGIEPNEVQWADTLKGDGSGAFGSTDDDEDVFDLDETLPISPTQEASSEVPGIRSPSPGFDGDEQILSGSVKGISTYGGVKDPLSLPIPKPSPPLVNLPENYPAGRRGFANPPFSLNQSHLHGISSLVASLPNPGLTTTRGQRGQFKRRNVTKYNTDNDNIDERAKSPEALPGEGYDMPQEEDERQLVQDRSPYSASLPMPIRRPDGKPLDMPKTENAIEEHPKEIVTEEGESMEEQQNEDRDCFSESQAFAMDEDQVTKGQDRQIPSIIPVDVDVLDRSPPEHPAPASFRIGQPFPSYSTFAENVVTTPPRLSPSAYLPATDEARLASVSNHATHLNPYPSHRQDGRPPLLNPFIVSPAGTYATPIAAAVAAAAEREPDGYDVGSVVGGIDGRTGLDPDVNSHRRGSLAFFGGIASRDDGRKRATSLVNGKLPDKMLKEVQPERMSFSMRFALEEAMGEARKVA